MHLLLLRRYIDLYFISKWYIEYSKFYSFQYDKFSVKLRVATPALTGNTDIAHYTSIPGIRAWYDANLSRSYTISGGYLTEWRDKSGWGINLIQVNGGNGPTASTSKIYGANSFLFTRTSGNTSNNGFQNNNVPIGTFSTELAVFCVFLKAGTLATNEFIPACRAPDSVYGILQGYNNTRRTGNGNSGNNQIITMTDIGTYTGGKGHISEFVITTSNFSEWVDETNYTSTAITNMADNGSGTGYSRISVGVSSDGTSWCHYGYIAESLYFVGALTTSQRLKDT